MSEERARTGSGRTTDEDRARDAEARRIAQTCFDRPLVLEAGAGTGKTAVLVARTVTWALGPGWERAAARLRAPAGPPPPGEEVAAETLRRVVAITFTDAAAAEMATRVGRALREIQHGVLPLGIAEEALPSDALERRFRARALLGTLDQLVVRTIHAFGRRLLVAHPLEAGLHPRFEIDADGRRQAEIAREVVEGHLPEAYGDPADPDWLGLAEAGIGPAALEQALLGLAAEGTPPAALGEDPFGAAHLRALAAAIEEATAAFLVLEEERLRAISRPSSVGAATAAAVALLRETLAGIDWGGPQAPAQLAAALGAVLEEKHLDRLGAWARGTWNKSESEAIGDDAQALGAAAGQVRRLVRHARRLDPRALGAARRVLQPLLARAGELARTRGVQSFGGILRDTRDLLEPRQGAAQRIRAEIDQLLVDEFQDTDAIQCDMLRALALEGPASSRPGLFLVGDPKQSIYGWRSADLRAYAAFLEDVRRAGGVVERLVVNFRSVPPILEEVARVVSPIMQECEARQAAFQRLLPCDARAQAPLYRTADHAPVEHWASFGVGADGSPDPGLSARQVAELEARAVACDLVRLEQSGIHLGRVALLLRGIGDLDVYLGALREAGIPFVVERDPQYYQRRECIDAAALVRCILDPHDQLALVTALRSPLAGVPDAAWLPLWRHGFPGLAAELRGDGGGALDRMRAAVEAAVNEVPGDVPGLGRIDGWPRSLIAFLEVLSALRATFDRKPATLFVEALRTCSLFEATESARYLGSHRIANLDRFFRDLAAALEESGGDVSAVLSHLRRSISEAREHEEGRPRDVSDRAVQVMTIHKAKGLDFDHVYLLQLHRQSGRGEFRETRMARWADRFEYTLFGMPTPGFHAVERERQDVEREERVRLLYVAMTRARERLVLVGRPATGSKRAGAERVKSHADLLAHRSPPGPDPLALMERLAREGRSHHEDEDGVRWVFPALRSAPSPSASDRPSSGTSLRSRVARDAEHLERAARSARARAGRPFHGVASEEADLVEDALRRGYGEDGEPSRQPAEVPVAGLDRRLALALGSAVHAAFEQIDPRGDARSQREGFERGVEAALALVLGPEERAPALERARRLWESFSRTPLLPALRRIADHVVARELPILLAPEESGGSGEGPVGYVAGAIDLLYRDPDDGAWVVADYKTDAVDPEAAEERAETYRRQGDIYVRAVQRALLLDRPPRFELWFLGAGRIVALDGVSGAA